jgi:hypothetical protein
MIEGALAERWLDDGRVIAVVPLMYGVRLTIGRAGLPWYDDGW